MKQYLKVATIVVVTMVIVNTFIKRVPVAGSLVGAIVGGL